MPIKAAYILILTSTKCLIQIDRLFSKAQPKTEGSFQFKVNQYLEFVSILEKIWVQSNNSFPVPTAVLNFGLNPDPFQGRNEKYQSFKTQNSDKYDHGCFQRDKKIYLENNKLTLNLQILLTTLKLCWGHSITT